MVSMNKRIRTRALLLLILLISRTVDAQKPAEGTTDDERLQFLIAAYDDNRNRFTEFSARFRVVKGSAASDEGAIAGQIAAAHDWWTPGGSKRILSGDRYVKEIDATTSVVQ